MRVKNPVRTLWALTFHKAPLEAQIIVTRRCNLSCGYCTEYDDVSKPVELSLLKERLDALHRLNVVNISILGGEPLMHPDITEIVRYADTRSQVSITTNGFLITESLIKDLNHAGLCNMEVSIDSFQVDRTGYIQKNLKTLKPKLQLLKEFAKFDVHINIVLCENTKNTFKDTVAQLRDFGFHVSLDLLHDEKGKISIQGEDYIKLWDEHYLGGAMYTQMDYIYGRSLLEGKKPGWKCRAGSRVLYIDEFGKVQYCSSQRGVLDKAVTEYSKKDLKEQSKLYKGCEEGCSILCVYRDSMLDNQPLTVLKNTAQMLKSGVFTRTDSPKSV